MSHRVYQLSDEERAARSERVHVATEANKRAAAVRALDDPAKVARAIRVVAHGIARGVVDPADVAQLVDQAVAQGHGRTVTDPDVLRTVAALVRSGGGDG